VGREPLSWDEYAAGWSRLHGTVDLERASTVVRGWLRLAYRGARLLSAVRVSPDGLTLAGLLLSAGVPAVATLGGGWPLAAAGLVLLSSLADGLDGALAVVTGRATRWGYLIDSVADRLSELAWLIALWLIGAPAWLAVAGGTVTFLHEYARARATAAGMAGVGTVTVSERPTRVIVVVIGLLAAGVTALLRPSLVSAAATVSLAVWVALGVVGLAQLGVAIRQALRP
jgi:CDP-diacylglycerol--glycerol-3-phosphate 3-phosphatidyltransferase